MSLQLSKPDELPNGRLTIKAYKNTLQTAKGTSYGRVQSPSDRVNISNLSALIADRNPGIQPAMVAFVARLLHEETIRQLREGKDVEVLGLGTAYITTKGSMKGLKPGVADVPKMTLKFKTAKDVKKLVQGITAKLVVPMEIKPVINTVIDMKTRIANEAKLGTVLQIKGKRLRVEGNKSEVGLTFIKGDGAKINVPISNIIRNEPSTLEVILPSNMTSGSYYVHVANQVKVKDGFSNTVRIGVSEFKFDVKS